MNFLKVLVILLIVFVGFGLLAGGCVYSGYNKSVGLDEEVGSRWAQVENQLQRRFDLIPNLVETVKGIAGQEKDVFLGIAKSREAYFQAKKTGTTGDQVRAATGLGGALSRLLLLQERYPELRSNQSFLKLQDSLEGTENRISVERQRYNEAVKNLNTFCRKLTGRFYAGLAGVEKAEYFKVAEETKAPPKVDFSGPKDEG